MAFPSFVVHLIMGKTAKKAAKRRQAQIEAENGNAKRAKQGPMSFVKSMADVNDCARSDNLDGNLSICSNDLEATLRTLEQLVADRALFSSERFRPLRKLLHPLTDYYQTKVGMEKNSVFKRISEALKNHNFDEALIMLEGLRGQGHSLKLGTVQRWVRDALILCPELTDKQTVNVLDAILRIANPVWDKTQSDKDQQAIVGTVVRNPDWSSADTVPSVSEYITPAEYLATPALTPRSTCETECKVIDPHTDKPLATSTSTTTSTLTSKSTWKPQVVAHEKASDRRPPNKFDLRIWTEMKGIEWDCIAPHTTRHEVTFVDKAYFLDNVLSHNECEQILSLTHEMGYDPDVPLGGSQSLEQGVAREGRAQACVWLASENVTETIFNRCKALLDQTIGKCQVVGINARFRCYRYVPGNLYGPHVDGAWPGSGMVDDTYQYDAFGDRWSKMTFLIYLNDDFEGGQTTFYMPGPTLGSLAAYGVKPRKGGVLLFPHGDTSDSLVHEGSSVLSGNKFVIRTDLLYTTPTKHTSMHNKHMRHNDDELRRMRR
eukprot:CFRG6204T1